MFREVIQGIATGLVAIVAVVIVGSFGGSLYSKLAHHGDHGKSGEHSSEKHGDSNEEEKNGESSGASEEKSSGSGGEH
jgi:hypothetical protein